MFFVRTIGQSDNAPLQITHFSSLVIGVTETLSVVSILSTCGNSVSRSHHRVSQSSLIKNSPSLFRIQICRLADFEKEGNHSLPPRPLSPPPKSPYLLTPRTPKRPPPHPKAPQSVRLLWQIKVRASNALFHFVCKLGYSYRSQQLNPKKVYCIDAGLLSVLTTSSSQDAGRRLENKVYLELLRRDGELHYYAEARKHITSHSKSASLQICGENSEGSFF